MSEIGFEGTITIYLFINILKINNNEKETKVSLEVS